MRFAPAALLLLVGCAPPEISRLDVDMENFVATFTVDVERPAGLEGGTVLLDFDGEDQEFGIGQQATLSGSELSFEHFYSPCKTSEIADVDITVLTAQGRESNVLSDDFQLEGHAIIENEPNDSAANRFDLDYNVGLCGELSSTGTNSANQYNGDQDYFRITPRVQGAWTLVLKSESGGAYDVWIDGEPTYATTSSIVEVDLQLGVDEDFLLGIMAGSGPTGQYSVRFE